MAYDLGSATFTLKAITRPLDVALKRIRNDINKFTSEANSKLGKLTIGVGVGGALGVAAGLGILARLIPNAAKGADDLELAMHRVRGVFQDLNPEVKDTIETLTRLGHTKIELAELAEEAGMMLKGMGANAQMTADYSSKLLKLASNARLVRGIELPDFLKLVEQGSEGSEHALRRLGMTFTDAQIRMRAWELMARGNIAATEQQQMRFAALSLIMERLDKRTEEAGWRQRQLGGTILELRGRLYELMIQFGEIIKPAYHEGIKKIISALQSLGDWMDRNKDLIKGWVTSISEGIAAFIKDPFGALKEGALKFGSWVLSWIETIIDVMVSKVKHAIQEIFNPAEASKWNPQNFGPWKWANELGAKARGGLMHMIFGGGAAEGVPHPGIAAAPPAAPVGPAQRAPTPEELKKLGMEQTKKNLPFIVKDMPAAVQAEILRRADLREKREAMAKKGGKKPVIEEPFPEIEPPRFARPFFGKAEFVDIMEFAKRITTGEMDTPEKQLDALLRIANATEMLAQRRELVGLQRQAFAVAAGPH